MNEIYFSLILFVHGICLFVAVPSPVCPCLAPPSAQHSPGTALVHPQQSPMVKANPEGSALPDAADPQQSRAEICASIRH